MPTPRRFIPDELKLWTDPEGRPIAVVEVTWRTICGLYLLAPTKRNTNLLLGVLGKAQDKYDFQIFALAFLSNHGSMLLVMDKRCIYNEFYTSRDCMFDSELGGCWHCLGFFGDSHNYPIEGELVWVVIRAIILVRSRWSWLSSARRDAAHSSVAH